ncbi:MAG: 3-phosphoserine/phosphohydroxythreonine transaminase [Planctomycetota bacterium]
MARIHNFGAGPAALPLPVLQEMQAELLDFRKTGMSILESSHRSKPFEAVIQSAESRVRRLLNIGDDYAVLFLQGGASLQFAMVPMNLLGGGTADYIDTGYWSIKALKEAKFFGTVNVPYSGKGTNYTHLPTEEELLLTEGAQYVHLTSNNTIAGTQYASFPRTETPLVADMSSDILSRPFDVGPFGLIYAGAQKNLGPSGITLVILRKDLAEHVPDTVPLILRYQTHIEADSLYHTPPTLAVWAVDLVCAWIEKEGGLAAMEQRNKQKSDALYASIDASEGFYSSPVERAARSKMNVVFRLPSEELEAKFLSEAAVRGLSGLKGHRSVGGMRASLYNAVEPASVRALVDFMADFAARNG